MLYKAFFADDVDFAFLIVTLSCSMFGGLTKPTDLASRLVDTYIYTDH